MPVLVPAIGFAEHKNARCVYAFYVIKFIVFYGGVTQSDRLSGFPIILSAAFATFHPRA